MQWGRRRWFVWKAVSAARAHVELVESEGMLATGGVVKENGASAKLVKTASSEQLKADEVEEEGEEEKKEVVVVVGEGEEEVKGHEDEEGEGEGAEEGAKTNKQIKASPKEGGWTRRGARLNGRCVG